MMAQVRRMALNQFANALPGVAAGWYERALLSPVRALLPERANHRVSEPETLRLPYGDGWIVTRTWGSGPVVLLLHGWNGTASDMDAFVEPLLARSFRVVAFDAPAHGNSDGRRTNLVQCAGAALQVGRVYGPVWGAVAHSFGAPTVALAGQFGLAIERMVLIGPPLDMPSMAERRALRAGFPRHVIELGNKRLAERLQVQWKDIRTDRLVSQLGGAVLVIHDADDRVVPWDHGAAIAAAASDGRLVTTTGLGHDAVLWDEGVVRHAVEFLGGERARP